MKYTKFFTLLLTTSLLFSCLTGNTKLNTNFDKESLVGKITDKDNQPCTNVLITLDNSSKTTSDINGTFYFENVKRGKHQFKFSKPGYKEEIREYEFLNISQVIYQKMISMEQILAAIEESINQKKYTNAQYYLEEGKKIDPNHPILNYLYGILYYQLERYDLAIEKFELILKNNFKEPFVYLTLTDIYEYQKTDYVKAYEYIRKYLELVDDNAAKLREIILKGNLPKEEPAPEAAEDPLENTAVTE